MKWFHKNPNKKDSNEGKIPIKTIIVFLNMFQVYIHMNTQYLIILPIK